MQDRFCPLAAGSGRQLENDASAIQDASQRRAVEISGAVEDQIRAWVDAVVGIETESVQDAFFPGTVRLGAQLEHRADICPASQIRCSIEVAGSVEDQATARQ